MKRKDSRINNVFTIEPEVHSDSRGSFMEIFRLSSFEKFNISQINQAFSNKKCIRGLHFQKKPFEQSKLVWVPKGEVLDIVVDLNKNSNTFLEHEIFHLTDKNHKMLFVPKGFAHGYITLTNKVVFNYALDEYYNPKYDSGINFFDREININVDIDLNGYELSKKDKTLPFLKDITF